MLSYQQSVIANISINPFQVKINNTILSNNTINITIQDSTTPIHVVYGMDYSYISYKNYILDKR